MSTEFIAIFVEGETEKEFYNELIKYYRKHSVKQPKAHRVINIKGISKFESKMSLKLNAEILNKHSASNVHVICCHDTDVFELAQKPPVDWKSVKKKMESIGVKTFHQVKAQRMIEDWFLVDIEGICRFLKLKGIKKIDGSDGNDKLKKLFKKGGKLYIKGTHTQKFIPALDIKAIRDHVVKEIIVLEKALGVTIPDTLKGKKDKLKT